MTLEEVKETLPQREIFLKVRIDLNRKLETLPKQPCTEATHFQEVKLCKRAMLRKTG